MSEGPGADDFLGAMADLQARLEQAQSSVAARDVTGEAAGGRVRVTLSGDHEARAVHIDAGILAGGDASLVEDLVLAALRDAEAKVRDSRTASLGDVLGALGALGGGEDDKEQGTGTV